jgi:NDP-sugar pyrophosphorylase family protein
MKYKVLIPTAGIGSRLGAICKYLNKSLIAVANKPTLSYIVESFPEEIGFVIALGYKGELVKEFLSLAYPRRSFEFSIVDPYEGQGAGLGLSILTCKPLLQCPFVFFSCDTIVLETIPAPDSNWMGYADVESLSQFRTLRLSDNTISEICEKGSTGVDLKAYIGLSGIHDYAIFWDTMEKGRSQGSIEMGEVFGLRPLLASGISPMKFTWYDTGNQETLSKARKVFTTKDDPNILEKPDEAIWFVNGNVIKYSNDSRFIANRVRRAEKIKGFCPLITGFTEHMYRYQKVKGDVLSRLVTLPIFDKLLDFSKNFWIPSTLSQDEQERFRKVTMRFYKDKTEERIKLFYKTFEKKDKSESINGIVVPSMVDILSRVDWSWLADGCFGRFHGDYHFENIIYSPQNEEFCFLDWRQDFGGSLETGDIYYDFAKINHGLIMSHEIVFQNQFWVTSDGNNIRFDFHRKQMLVDCERQFEKFINQNGWDYRKVQVLTSLIYLNIASLHHYPYCLLLYYLGKSSMWSIVNKQTLKDTIH